MKKILSVTAFTALLTLTRMVSGFVIAKVVAIYTGPTGMAMLGQLQSAVTLVNGVVNAPVGSAVVRYTAETQNEDDQYNFDNCIPWWRSSIAWAMLLILIVCPISLLSANEISLVLFETNERSWLIIIAVFLLPFSALYTVFNSIINGQQQYRKYVTFGVISVITTTFFMIFMISYDHLNGALIAAATQTAILGLCMILLCLKEPWLRFSNLVGNFKKENFLGIGKYVAMGISSAIMVPVTLVVIRNILVENVGWIEAGYWQSVWRISEVYLGVITLTLSTYYLPRLSKLTTYEEIKKEINNTAKVVMPIVIILAVIVYCLRDFAIFLLFTNEFSEARDLFSIQLLGDVIKILSWLYAFPMLSKGAAKWFVGSEVLFSCTLMSLTYVLVPIYQTQGANLAYLINYVLYFVFVLFALKRVCKV
ncbi:O-antigen translocase [Enterovibrio norvegicus]|uniref:O-antigen translocase n=1 Tax=Enterovibrio norvegicus TaxID=188144 RepID=UPI00352F054E